MIYGVQVELEEVLTSPSTSLFSYQHGGWDNKTGEHRNEVPAGLKAKPSVGKVSEKG